MNQLSFDRGNRALAQRLQAAVSEQTINLWEARLIRAVIQREESREPGGRLGVFPCELVVSNPADASGEFHFTFGFAIGPAEPSKPTQLLSFRIQDHLRKMGLARRATQALLRFGPDIGVDAGQRSASREALGARKELAAAALAPAGEPGETPELI